MRALSTAVWSERLPSKAAQTYSVRNVLGSSNSKFSKGSQKLRVGKLYSTGQICGPSEFLKIKFYWNRVTSIC